jgi:hypothetical protein
LVVNVMNVHHGNLIGQFMIVFWEMQWLSLGLGSIHGRGWRRGEQTVGDRVCEPIVLGKEGQADTSIGFNEIVNW